MFKIIFKFKYLLVLIIFAILIYAVSKTHNGVAFAVETVNSGFGMSVSPTTKLLGTDNMAPGDKVAGELTVSNTGEYDFVYDISSVKASGNDLLYNTLKLTIKNKANGDILFNDKLNKLNKLVLGILGRQYSDSFLFEASLPGECGNEYQNLDTNVTFVLNANEHPPYIQGGIVWDPPLEKPDVFVRRGIIMPIKFHIVNSDGNFDIQKRGINLEITGIVDNGEQVKYIFSIADGTLEWEEHGLKKPHYSLMFSTEKYPVKYDTFYTATVKYGEQILGSTLFKSGK